MKTCKRCERELPYFEFYIHKQMSDGYLSFCKECTKARVKKHRAGNLDRIQAYDRDRPNKQQRHKDSVERTKAARNTPEGRKKLIARSRLDYAVRTGKLVRPNECGICCSRGRRIEAHHHDYNKPLDVEWLCVACHGIKHRSNK